MKVLKYLSDYGTLSRDEAHDIMLRIAANEYSPSEMASFMTVFMMRPISVDELIGFTEALQECCLRVDLQHDDVTDLVGTGGDCKNTFNISTLSAFVVAGAGVKVAKHGNYGVSSQCGSSNVLEALGYRFTADVDTLRRQMDAAGICFLHAPLFNQAMKAVAPVRKALGVKTFFNILGPLVNPAFPQIQTSGVYDLEVARLYQYLFQQTGKRFCVIHSLDGYDEVSLTGQVKVINDNGEELLTPEELGFSKVSPESIAGGENVNEAKQIFLNIISGEGTTAQNEVVIANSALALQCARRELSRADAIEMARLSLLSGRAKAVLNTLLNC